MNEQEEILPLDKKSTWLRKDKEGNKECTVYYEDDIKDALKKVEEKIKEFHIFLDCDLFSKFSPQEEINGEIFVREDHFKNKKDFYEYLDEHFNLFRKQIKEIFGERFEKCLKGGIK